MPRNARIEFEGAVYHVMSRGLRGENIFRDDLDRKIFLSTLTEGFSQTGWVVHAYVLMGNHYHLLLETPEANLSMGMQWFQGTYAKRFKAKHRLLGPVFNNRFKSLLIQSDQPEYFRRVADYIHLNPARAGFLDRNHPVLKEYYWSSFPYYVGSKRKRPVWLACQKVLEDYPRMGDTPRGREGYREELEERARKCMKGEVGDELGVWKGIRRGWYIGDEKFRVFLEDKLEEVFVENKRSSYTGESARRHDERAAEELIEKACLVLGVEESSLQDMKQRDVRKQGVAWVLKSNTVMSNEWISQKLQMGSRTNIFTAVKAYEKKMAGTATYRRLLNRIIVNK